MPEQTKNMTAASVYSALSALLERIERRDATDLNENDINKVMAEHIRNAVLKFADHADLDALATEDAPGHDKLRAAYPALEKSALARDELRDLLEIMEESLSTRSRDLVSFFQHTCSNDLCVVTALAESIKNVRDTAWKNLTRHERAFRKETARHGVQSVPKPGEGI